MKTKVKTTAKGFKTEIPKNGDKKLPKNDDNKPLKR